MTQILFTSSLVNDMSQIVIPAVLSKYAIVYFLLNVAQRYDSALHGI